jgi:hypothetical protein
MKRIMQKRRKERLASRNLKRKGARSAVAAGFPSADLLGLGSLAPRKQIPAHSEALYGHQGRTLFPLPVKLYEFDLSTTPLYHIAIRRRSTGRP